jgi:hypothetical protein
VLGRKASWDPAVEQISDVWVLGACAAILTHTRHYACARGARRAGGLANWNIRGRFGARGRVRLPRGASCRDPDDDRADDDNTDADEHGPIARFVPNAYKACRYVDEKSDPYRTPCQGDSDED